jgi:hypothetical protein
LAEAGPAHCQYCYLAGSLKGSRLTWVYASLPEILGELAACLGHGTITLPLRRVEGTMFVDLSRTLDTCRLFSVLCRRLRARPHEETA